MNAQAAMKSYSAVRTDASAQAATPHQLIQMLFDGALERIAQAKGAMQQKNITLKGEKISSAINIVGGLKDNLDLETGGEVAENLASLYDYIQRRLMEAHSKNDPMILDEAAALIIEVSDAWKQIG
ncbi:MAG: flagellar export chaperone FliS [Cellvibrionaceae bacterium]